MSIAVTEACQRIRDSISLSSIAGKAVKLRRAGREWVGCCPFHPDRSPSFTIYADDRRFCCFGCGAQGDVLDFVGQIERVGLIDAIRMIDEGLLPTRQLTAPPPRAEDGPSRLDEARAIWQASVPAEGTEAAAYLAWRGLAGPIPSTLRFSRLSYGRTGPLHPVLIAIVTDGGGRAQGIQRTYLARDGQGKLAVDKPKLSLGRIKGGAIRLAPPGRELVLAEGMEDALTLQHGLGLPAWAAAGAGMLPSVGLPPGVRSIVIGSDADEAGIRSAEQARDRFTADGRSVRILRPAAGFKDFNAEHCAGLAAAA